MATAPLPFPLAVIRTDRSDVSAVEEGIANVSRERWDNEGTGTPSIISRLPSALAILPRRLLRTYAANLSRRYWKRFWEGQITGRRSSIIEIYSVKLLEILNFTQKNCANVSREARILMKRKSLVRLLKEGGKVEQVFEWITRFVILKLRPLMPPLLNLIPVKGYKKKEFAEFQGKVRRCDAILWIIYLRISFVECKLWKLK